jgi:hypothetical protein
MEIRPFVNSGPEILPLDTDFWIPDGFEFTGCRWNHYTRKRARDNDGQVTYAYVKKFALEGGIGSYKYGEQVGYPLDIKCQAGLICSPHTFFMVVECDTIELWDDSVLGDATPTVRSRRGFHYYFHVPAGLVHLMPTDGPISGGDVQTRGFVPCPGSEHPSGVKYELVSNRINVADSDLLHRISKAREIRKAQELEAYRKSGGEGAWSGDGGVYGHDDYLAKIVTWNAVFEGKTEDEVRSVWQAEAAALPQTPGDPFTEDDFQRHYKGAADEWKIRQAARSETEVIDATIMDWVRSTQGSGGSGSGGDGVSINGFEDDGDRFLPVGYRLPADYSLAGGVSHTTRHGKDEDEEQIAQLPIYVSGLEIDSDDVSWYELTWETHDGSGRKIIIPSGHIADRTNLMRAFPEVVVTTKGATAAAEYLAACRKVNADWLAQENRTRRVALRLGWYGNRIEEGFVSGPERPYQVRDVANLGGWLQGHRPHGHLAEWTAILSRMPIRVVMLTAAALAAPLLKILEVPGFVLDNSGGTTQGKTRAARVAASVWGDPDRLLLSWSATKAALEIHAQKANGTPLLIDDSKLARDGEQIAGLVYQVTSGLMTGRLERSSDRLRGGDEIKTVILTNGETPLLTAGKSGRRDGGAVARVLEMWGAPFGTAEEADSVNAVIRENYGLAGEEFVRSALKTGAGELRSQYQELRLLARGMGTTDVARRRADAGAVVMLAAQIANRAGLLPIVPTAFWPTLLGEGAAGDSSDDLALAALELVWGEVAFNDNSFWRPDSGAITNSFDRPRDGWKGRYDRKESWLAVKPDWLDRFLAERGFESEGVRRQWDDRGWTAKDTKGRRSISIRIAGEVARCVKIIHRPESISTDSSAIENSEAEL